ncbi:5-formyltetrahydrofolate cyclo-ligase [Ornithinimicrobium avium]|uniref:5-formyltetrahydrofolate cyclo-ligase n=1 Tax=Ornithinimicrobium avium TaxID=2283195 RepID=A0A345NQF2_9MICO|nr:5-formyltetrahydrofolate cyclo-ligase [Ornithinimicrobium avium]AXH97260.1 5-formyltetrahydrofolate cyclo-ligase [Ornithinimicrobium avium]
MSPSQVLPAYEPTGDVVADKVTWRALVRAERRALAERWTPQVRAEAGAALGRAGLSYLEGYAARSGRGGVAGMCVTAYEPMRTEPPVDGLTEALLAAGVRVLVPVTLTKPRLDWADLTDPDRQQLGPEVLAQVDVAFVPALAISAQGVRLGQGGGYYDTTLPRMRELSGGAPVVVCLHDHEVVPAVPADEHDAVMDAVLRPGSGVVAVPVSRPAPPAGA